MITITLTVFLFLAMSLAFVEQNKHEAPFANISNTDRAIEQMTCIFYIASAFVIVLLAGFRNPGVDADSLAYVGNYYGLGTSRTETLEPSFFLIAYTAKLFNEVQIVFILYAILSIPIKAYAIFRLSHFKMLSLMVWISHFLLLQDMTQIRVAVATGLFLYALYYLIIEEKKKYFLLCLLSILFHYSALLLIPLVVLGTKHMNKLWKYTLFTVPIIFYIMYFMGVNIVSILPLGAFQDKLDTYESLRDKGIAGDEINIFNMLAMFRLLTYYTLLIMYETVYTHCKEITLYLKIYCISICCYVGLSFLPALAIRGSEVYAVIDVVTIPCLVYTVKPSWLMKLLVAVFAIGLFVMNIVLSRYIREFV